MKIAVTGANGNLGRELVNMGATPISGDITDVDQIRENIREVAPDVLIHAAGKSGVDWTHQNYTESTRINFNGAANVIDQWAFPNIRFIYISSSHVFDGKKKRLYTEKDRVNPINDYGLIKLASEMVAGSDKATIIRLSTMFSNECFEIGNWREGYYDDSELISVPDFFTRTYAHVRHIAQGVMEVATHYDSMPKLLNISGTQNYSMYEFAMIVANYYGWDKERFWPRNKELVESGMDKRPRNAGLDTRLARKFGVPLYSAIQGVELL